LTESCYLIFDVCFIHQCLHKFVKLVTRESAQFDSNDSEPKSQIKLHKKFSKTRIVKSILSFFQYQNENECFSPRSIVDHKVKAVVCLRGGERGTCLGAPFLGAPLRCYTCKFSWFL